MVSNYIVSLSLLILMILTIISCSTLTKQVLGASPFFARQEITQSINHLNLFSVNNGGNCTNMQKEISQPHIEAVSYSSNSKVLNATIWLSGPFEDHPLPLLRSPRYLMAIGVNPSYNMRIDYLLTIAWDPFVGTWSRTLSEISSNDTRVLKKEPNYKGFFDSTEGIVGKGGSKGHVNFSLDLAALNSPDHYFLYFGIADMVVKKGNLCGVINISNNVAYVPPPKFIVTAPLSSLESLRPGEEKIIPLRINSTISAPSSISLSTSETIDGIKLTFLPERLNLTSQSSATISSLKIDISGDAEKKLLPNNEEEHPYQIPINAKISLPEIDLDPLIGKSNKTSQSLSLKQPYLISQSIFPQPSYLIITIHKPPSLEERFTAFWGVWGSLIGLVGGGFAAGFAALVFDRVRKKTGANNSSDEKANHDNSNKK
jgi:hypothetical protein